MLDKRLRCVAGLVRPGSVLADIGTDHAHLPVWLVKEGVCPRAVAADIRIGPAAAARRSVEAAGLEDVYKRQGHSTEKSSRIRLMAHWSPVYPTVM